MVLSQLRNYKQALFIYLIICYADRDVYNKYEGLFHKVVTSLRSEKIKIGE